MSARLARVRVQAASAHVRQHARRYGWACVALGALGTVGPLIFDFALGVAGNLVASVVGPIVGVR